MSFSFSQNLLSDISDSQSDSSQPLTQPMTNCTNISRQNMAIPRPPSFPLMSTQSAASVPYSFPDQQRAKYTRVENSIPSQSTLGDILRETQIRINSIPSSSSRMLEEALVFLEENVKKEQSETLAGIKSVSEILQTVKSVLILRNEESNKSKSLVKPCLLIAQSLKKLLDVIAKDQEDTSKVLDYLEEGIQEHEQLHQDVLKKLSHTVDALNYARGKEADEEEMFKKKSEKISYYSSNTRSKYDFSTTAPFTAKKVVRNFSSVRRQEKPVIDFSSVMEVDSDSEDEWEE